jgi:hypothetical protein
MESFFSSLRGDCTARKFYRTRLRFPAQWQEHLGAPVVPRSRRILILLLKGDRKGFERATAT